MITFLLCLVLLLTGYFVYGRLVEKRFAPTDEITPAFKLNDGVDYMPMPVWKVFLIQLLNIAGTGPIFGALSGALFGPIVYLWIVLGCVFAGAVHDFSVGMISVRSGGSGIAEITGRLLGKKMLMVMRVFSVILLIMCGVVFTKGPADLLAILTPEKLNADFWFWVVLIYYFIATFLPIDKIIGRLYPVFGVLLIAMALGVAGSVLFSGKFQMPELWTSFENLHPDGTEVWPFMFITVACGAISGFHATQTPIMARCIKSEKDGRRVFYGAMIAEGIIALIWAAAGVSCYESGRALLDAGGGCSQVVYAICQSTMGKIGCALGLLGVIVCPLSSGDTAFRSARLTIADWFKINQTPIKKRLLVTVPLLAVGFLISRIDYTVVWRYFSWANQTLAMIALWAAATYLFGQGKKYFIVFVPAAFMTAVTATYFCAAPECLGLMWTALGISKSIYYPAAIAAGLVCAFAAAWLFKKHIKHNNI